jgi:hypothetical protein
VFTLVERRTEEMEVASAMERFRTVAGERGVAVGELLEHARRIEPVDRLHCGAGIDQCRMGLALNRTEASVRGLELQAVEVAIAHRDDVRHPSPHAEPFHDRRLDRRAVP